MKTCAFCHQKFPDHLVQDLVACTVNGKLTHTPCDAICALKKTNAEMGLPEGTPFRAPIAKALYKQTVDYLAKKGVVS